MCKVAYECRSWVCLLASFDDTHDDIFVNGGRTIDFEQNIAIQPATEGSGAMIILAR